MVKSHVATIMQNANKHTNRCKAHRTQTETTSVAKLSPVEHNTPAR